MLLRVETPSEGFLRCEALHWGSLARFNVEKTSASGAGGRDRMAGNREGGVIRRTTMMKGRWGEGE
jgi:hypothetical protein